MSDIEKMTQKAQEAMQAAARLAEERHHSAVEAEHLMYEVLRQDDGIVPRVLSRMDVPVKSLIQDFERRLQSLPHLAEHGCNQVLADVGIEIRRWAQADLL